MRIRAFVSKFRTRYGAHADAILYLGPVWFHLSKNTDEGHAYSVSVRTTELKVRW